jgi:hypothetical protein
MTEILIYVAIGVAVIVGAGFIGLAWKLGVFDGRDPEEEIELALWRARRNFDKACNEWNDTTKED